MDLPDGSGIQVGITGNPRPAQVTSPNTVRGNQTESGVSGNQKAVCKEGGDGSTARNRPISEPVIPSPKDSQRPVINLKPLNQFIKKQRFKMERAKLIRDLLRRNNWMVSTDLKDAYLSVPISPQHRKFLRFPWKDSLFNFQCVPFGLTSAPIVFFTKLLKPVMALLRQKGIRCIILLDDMAQSKEELQKQTQDILTHFQLLGFRINWDKSVLSPTQMIEYLGLQINSISMAISLPQEEITNIIQSCKATMEHERVLVQELSRLIGRMIATAMAVLPAPLCYRNL